MRWWRLDENNALWELDSECQGLQEVGEGFCKFKGEDINDEIHLLHYFYLG